MFTSGRRLVQQAPKRSWARNVHKNEAQTNNPQTLFPFSIEDRYMLKDTGALAAYSTTKAQYLLEGNNYYQAGRYEEAMVSYARAIQCDPTCSSAFHNLGSTLLRLRRFKKALRAFQGATLLNPADAIAHCGLGDALSELACYEDALRAYATSLRLEPSRAMTYNNLGVLLDQMHNYEGALRSCACAVQLDPADAISNYNLSRLLAKLGRIAEAREAYLRARTLGLEEGDL